MALRRRRSAALIISRGEVVGGGTPGSDPRYHARASVCRAGVTYAGLTGRTFAVSVGGVSRTAHAQANVNFSILKSLDGDSALTLTFDGAPPVEGQDAIVTLGGELFFGGTVQRVRSVQTGQIVKSETVCSDWRWLLNRYARVTGTFTGGINAVVARLLATYSNGGFLPGSIPQALGNITITCDDEGLWDVILRIARGANNGAGAFVRLTPYKRVDIGTTFHDGINLAITNTSDYRSVSYERTLDQVRTRVQARGVGTDTTAPVSPGATTIPVSECGIFPGSGSVWVSSVGVVAYAGKSAAIGPGALTGVSGLSAPVPQGATVQVYAVADDGPAQSALASALGGGRSGVAVHSVANEAWSSDEVSRMASAHLSLLKAPMRAVTLSGVTVTAGRLWQHEPGTILTSTVTQPQTIDGQFRVQRVNVSAMSSLAESEPIFRVTADARSTVGVDLFNILGTLS